MITSSDAEKTRDKSKHPLIDFTFNGKNTKQHKNRNYFNIIKFITHSNIFNGERWKCFNLDSWTGQDLI